MATHVPGPLFPAAIVPDPKVALQPPERFPGLTAQDRAPHEEIMHRAYAIWEGEGHPDGRHLAHWAQAEAEILRCG